MCVMQIQVNRDGDNFAVGRCKVQVQSVAVASTYPGKMGSINDEEKDKKAPPQSKAVTVSISNDSNNKSDEKSSKNETSTNKKNKDDDIAALTEGLGSVSIAPKPTDKELAAPEAIKHVANLLASNKYSKIVILTGAGVSCNAGIPDFRTPGTGLYDNLQKYNLPVPEAVFNLEFYQNNPTPFVQLASELWPGLKHSPTITHSFIALLEKKGMLLRNYTQNIDCLDVLAGVSEEKMIECHGHFRTASCTRCERPFDSNECKRIIVEKKEVPKCKHCKGYIKPDIVFFGEALPSKFHRNVKKDTKNADLLMVMGTSLMVGPVNQIPDLVGKKCPRVLFNRELVGSFQTRNGMKTRRKSYDTSAQRDTFHGADCDESIRLLCSLLGWEEELDELNASTRLG